MAGYKGNFALFATVLRKLPQPAVAVCYCATIATWAIGLAKSVRKYCPADGLIVDEVGPWAEEKHLRLKRYIDLAKGARAKFIPPRGSGGASYIELFSGPGRLALQSSCQSP